MKLSQEDDDTSFVWSKIKTYEYCYSHGKSLPSNAGLMVGKRVLQGEAWSDLSDSRGTHDLGDKLGDHFGDLATNLATLATNRLFSKMQSFSRYFY
ncbi:hypothetical protein AVEN_251835-1 [Araneus ventricosus]|uniref:Uncharacterized protein n=1 Tax=Araneus ventricosus TaxID=182803 RepID=A0A4Y2FXE9_ARAVE|nr:hypothetical protein AVEN_251835-1 [Araneus ventricosus]